MAAIVIKRVGTDKDFATIKLFGEWVCTQDLVAQDIMVDCQVESNQTSVSTLYQPLTFSKTCYALVRPAPGLGVNDLEPQNKFDYGTQGVELNLAHGSIFKIGHGCIFENFRIRLDDGGPSATTQVGINVGKPNGSLAPDGVVDATLRYCRILIQAQVATTRGVAVSEANSPGSVHDNLIIHHATAGTGGTNLTFLGNGCRVFRNTFVRLGNSIGSRAIYISGSGTYAFRDNLVLNGGSLPIEMGTGSVITNNWVNTELAIAKPGVNSYLGGLVVNPLTDFRPKVDSPLLNAGAEASNGTLDVRGGNRASPTDIGAWELYPALELPTATITNVTVTGRSIVITGTYTGQPASATTFVQTSGGGFNNAVENIGTVVFSGGNFTATHSDVKVGSYYPTVEFTNDGGTSLPATNPFGNILVIGAQGILTSQTIDGQKLTITGTTSGSPTSAHLFLSPAAEPNGAQEYWTVPVTLGAGTFNISLDISAGNYLAPVLRFTTEAGPSLPMAGTTAFTLISISGYPETPEVPETTAISVSDISLTPQNSVVAGEATKQFVAFVEGSNAPQTVTWSIVGAGTISTTGLYTAPASIDSIQTVTVKATSTHTPSVSKTVEINVSAIVIAPVVTGLTILPVITTLVERVSQLFVATVQGTNSPSQLVSWSVSGGGSITPSGMYTAPAAAETLQEVIVTAISVGNDEVSASIAFTIPASDLPPIEPVEPIGLTPEVIAAIAEAAAQSVWNRSTSAHAQEGTFGKLLSRVITIGRFLGLK